MVIDKILQYKIFLLLLDWKEDGGESSSVRKLSFCFLGAKKKLQLVFCVKLLCTS